VIGFFDIHPASRKLLEFKPSRQVAKPA
jgi:hypothetical protein